MSRRPLVFGAIFAVPLIIVGAACSFPDVSFSAVASPEAGVDGRLPDATDPLDAPSSTETAPPGPDVQPPVEAGASDAETRVDGQDIIVDESICATRPRCDCDGDNYRDEACARDAGDGGFDASLLPNDCDDRDPVRNPGETFRADTVDAAHQGDWNCNGIVERSPQINLACPPAQKVYVGIPGLGGHDEFKCSDLGAEGFNGAPKCGAVFDTSRCPTGQYLNEKA